MVIMKELFWLWFAVGGVLSFALTKIALNVFPRWNLLDFPERYGLTRKKLPYPGGLVFLLLSLGIGLVDASFLTLLPLILALGLVSFIDDRKNLPAWPRLFVHVGLVLFLYWIGVRIDFVSDPFSGSNDLLPLYLSLPLTVVWVLSIQHAMNWFDGLKGLSVGISGIGFLFLGILGLVKPELWFDPNHEPLLVAVWLLAGITLGGWWWFFKGKILLGDTGSQVLGFLLGVMSIFSGAKIGTTLLILALPLLDTFVVICRRIFIDKKSPFQGDMKHLHHNLARELGEKKSVLLLIGISVILGGVGVWLTEFYKLVAVTMAGILVLGLILWSYQGEEE